MPRLGFCWGETPGTREDRLVVDEDASHREEGISACLKADRA